MCKLKLCIFWLELSACASTIQHKQKARLQRLEAMQAQEGWAAAKDLGLDMRTGDKFGGTLLDVQGVRKAFGERLLIENASFSISPRDRLGIVGPNGAGKSTLLKILLGTLEADKGSLLRASRVKVGLLDQERTGLKETETVYEAAGAGNDYVRVGDQDIHVSSFLSRFLFTREHYDQKVSKLSGGERARLLMARLLLQGANLLMLDEPTNDLDLMTLRVLEDALLSYDGGVVVVTHDRAFLDRVCTAVLAFEPGGKIVRYASRQQAEAAAEALRLAAEPEVAEEAVSQSAAQRGERKAAQRAQRLSYREQKELEALPGKIEESEAEQEQINERLADPALYQGDAGAEVTTLSKRLAALETELEAMYARWEELEARA